LGPDTVCVRALACLTSKTGWLVLGWLVGWWDGRPAGWGLLVGGGSGGCLAPLFFLFNGLWMLTGDRGDLTELHSATLECEYSSGGPSFGSQALESTKLGRRLLADYRATMVEHHSSAAVTFPRAIDRQSFAYQVV